MYLKRYRQQQSICDVISCTIAAQQSAIRTLVSGSSKKDWNKKKLGVVVVDKMQNTDYNSSIAQNATTATATTTPHGLGIHFVGNDSSSSSSSSDSGAIPKFIKKSINIQLSALQTAPIERKLSTLIATKVAHKEFFYGIELAAHSFGPHPTVLDYNTFGTLLPLFTSIIWLGQYYWNVQPMDEVASIRTSLKLHPQTVVMPHFTCYRADHKRLSDLLALNFSNVLALRGDQVESEQDFLHASELVAEIRRLRKDDISIGVAGYPEGHPDAKSLEEDMDFLKRKVDAGADFIITQICFNAEPIIRFIEKCRTNGITIPIIVGIMVPETMYTLQRIMDVTKVPMATDQLNKYIRLKEKPTEFREYSVKTAVEMLTEIFNKDLDVYGIQFFTMNKFTNIKLVIDELMLKGIFENKI